MTEPTSPKPEENPSRESTSMGLPGRGAEQLAQDNVKPQVPAGALPPESQGRFEPPVVQQSNPTPPVIYSSTPPYAVPNPEYHPPAPPAPPASQLPPPPPAEYYQPAYQPQYQQPYPDPQQQYSPQQPPFGYQQQPYNQEGMAYQAAYQNAYQSSYQPGNQSVIGLICSIFGIVLCCCFPASLPLAITGIVLGHLQNQKAKMHHTTDTMAVLAFWLGIAAVCITLLYFILNIVANIMNPGLAEQMMKDMGF